MKNRTRLSLALSLLALAPAVVHAGPPLVCFPLDTGGAASLPWSPDGWKGMRADYDRARLAGDTVALLGPDARVLARMETLRRAVLYSRDDADAARQLFAALRARAARGGDERQRGLARFDLGYAVATFGQAQHASAPGSSAVRAAAFPAGMEDGYALVKEALSSPAGNAEMQYAAALVSATPATRSAAREHLRHAQAGAGDSSPLARTLAAHRELWQERPPQSAAR